MEELNWACERGRLHLPIPASLRRGGGGGSAGGSITYGPVSGAEFALIHTHLFRRIEAQSRLIQS